MEIPEIGIFEAGMKCLYFPGIQTSPKVYSFWKWGAVIVAFLATFTRLLKQIKYLIIHIRRIKPSPESLLQHLDVDFDLSDDDDSEFDETSVNNNNNSSSSDQGDDDDPESPSSAADYYMNFFTDFDVKGSINYFCLSDTDDEFNWGDFTTGKKIVKIWDSFGSSFGFDCFDDSPDFTQNVVSFWDRSSTAVTSPSPSLVLSAKMDEKENGVVLEAYDTRVKAQNPVSYAEWRRPVGLSRLKKEVTVTSGGVEKVYVGDVAAGDMRKLKTPLDELCGPK